MKFARLLRDTAKDLPELGPLFSMYKSLKKQLKRMEIPNDQANHQEEHRFVGAIDDSLQQLNDTFVEREETIIICMNQMQASAGNVAADQKQNLLRCLVNLHGEMLLLLHWSILAYSALVKILKKHYKRTGLLLDSPALQNLLSQPFCSTEVVVGLICQAETLIQSLSSGLPSTSCPQTVTPQGSSTAIPSPALPATTTQSGDNRGAGGVDRHAMLQHLSTHLTNMDTDDASEDSSKEDSGGGGVEDGDEATSSVHEQSQATRSAAPPLQPPSGTDTEVSSGSHDQWRPSFTSSSLPLPPASSSGVGTAQQIHTSSILRQTQVALETWSNLVNTASTPSTILSPEQMQRTVAGAALHHPHPHLHPHQFPSASSSPAPPSPGSHQAESAS